MKETMWKAMKKLKMKNWTIIAFNAMALMMVIQNVNVTCAWMDHQPDVPDSARRFRKF